MKIIRELKEFAVKGNVVDMAVGIMIGASFATVINSLVKDIISPVIGLFTSKADFSTLFIVLRNGTKGGPYAALADAQADHATTMNIGLLINAFISFTIVAFILFFIVKATNKLKRPQAVTTDPITTMECRYCLSTIAMKALRCPYCTADLVDTPPKQ